ncbi:hypothetical protein RHEC894_CH03561 [Rhizobium sp. CIAT894]|nr:hypothetical protein RHEC894_CH03561 [Rhizobium sp. CIAT894]
MIFVSNMQSYRVIWQRKLTKLRINDAEPACDPSVYALLVLLPSRRSRQSVPGIMIMTGRRGNMA